MSTKASRLREHTKGTGGRPPPGPHEGEALPPGVPADMFMPPGMTSEAIGEITAESLVGQDDIPQNALGYEQLVAMGAIPPEVATVDDDGVVGPDPAALAALAASGYPVPQVSPEAARIPQPTINRQERGFRADDDRWEKKLRAMPQVNFIAPVDPLNPKDRTVWASANGMGITVPRGKPLRIPLPHAVQLVRAKKGFITP